MVKDGNLYAMNIHDDELLREGLYLGSKNKIIDR